MAPCSLLSNFGVGVERIPQSIANQVHRQHQQNQQYCRKIKLIAVGRTCRLPMIIDQCSKRNVRGLNSETKKGKSDFGKDQAADVDRGVDDEEGGHVWKDVTHDDL